MVLKKLLILDVVCEIFKNEWDCAYGIECFQNNFHLYKFSKFL